MKVFTYIDMVLSSVKVLVVVEPPLPPEDRLTKYDRYADMLSPSLLFGTFEKLMKLYR